MPEPTLYERVLGERYDTLPAAVRDFHRLRGSVTLQGQVDCGAPASWPAAWLARAIGAPTRSCRGDLRFELRVDPQGETWIRHFPARTMRSRMTEVSGQLVERMGPAVVTFHLDASPDGLRMTTTGLRFLGLPCPAWLMPTITARETGHGGQLHFDVAAALPWIGTIVRYQGFLTVPHAPS